MLRVAPLRPQGSNIQIVPKKLTLQPAKPQPIQGGVSPQRRIDTVTSIGLKTEPRLRGAASPTVVPWQRHSTPGFNPGAYDIQSQKKISTAQFLNRQDPHMQGGKVSPYGFDSSPQATKDIAAAVRAYGIKPALERQIHKTGLKVGRPDSSGLINGAVAAGTYMPAPDTPNTPLINVDHKSTRGGSVILHEGLHSAWQNLANRRQFGQIYNQTVGKDPQLQSYLARRLGDYPAFANGNRNTADINQLDPSVRNEFHSYLSEVIPYIATNPKLSKKYAPLIKYYSQFFEPAKKANDNRIAAHVADTLPDRGLYPQRPIPAKRLPAKAKKK
jgi:hypothetical protein